jgi:hypothetical protein
MLIFAVFAKNYQGSYFGNTIVMRTDLLNSNSEARPSHRCDFKPETLFPSLNF